MPSVPPDHSATSISGAQVQQHLQARVNTTARMLAWGGTPLGALAGGVLAEAAGARSANVVMSSAVLISALLAWRSPLRDRTFGAAEPSVV